MRLLAIDTSGRALSAALAEDGEIIASFGVDEGKNHSLTLLPHLQQLLEEQQLSLAQMDAFAVTIGPGSFTGLRIGLATVKAWGQALAKPLVAISTLDAAAQTAAAHGYAAPILDARRDEVYTALYRDGQRLTPDRAVAPQQLAQELLALGQPVTFSGDAVQPYQALFEQTLGAAFCLPADGNTLFLAAAAARLACSKYAAGQTSEVAALVPVYLRLSEAEEKRLEALKDA